MKILRLIILSIAISTPSCQFQAKEMPETFEFKRKEMVENQIESRGVNDKRVLDAMRKVERHKFVPENEIPFAYEDHPLPIGDGQTISQPYIVAFMSEQLGLNGNERVLEIGTGSGYQAAVLAELCKEVYTIEVIPNLGMNAEKLLKNLGYENIKVKIGDGYLGWPEYAPFDAIIVTCAPGHIPKPLTDQLSEGGKMVIPVGEFFQELVLVKKINGKIVRKNILPVAFVPMVRNKK